MEQSKSEGYGLTERGGKSKEKKKRVKDSIKGGAKKRGHIRSPAPQG